MTLLIAVADTVVDGELVASARGLAKAAGWDARAVHVREPGGAELGSADAEGLEIVDLVGEAADEIARLLGKAEVDAVALGLRTAAGPGIGHVTEALLGRPSAPLLLVRPGMRPLTTLRRLLVPLEGSPSASSAMRHADDALCSRGREIVMLHVVTKSTPGERGSFPAPRIVDQEHYEWSAWQDEFCMRFSQCPEGGRHRVCMRVGEPAATIVKEAQAVDAELIVLSWKGSFAEGHGAVVKALLDTAPCPLLIVPAG
jgi:nucleotide-binding universal stress UspA family protein